MQRLWLTGPGSADHDSVIGKYPYARDPIAFSQRSIRCLRSSGSVATALARPDAVSRPDPIARQGTPLIGSAKMDRPVAGQQPRREAHLPRALLRHRVAHRRDDLGRLFHARELTSGAGGIGVGAGVGFGSTSRRIEIPTSTRPVVVPRLCRGILFALPRFVIPGQ